MIQHWTAFTVTEPHPECHRHRFSRISCCIYSIIKRIIAVKRMPVFPSLPAVNRRHWTCWPFKEAAQRHALKTLLASQPADSKKGNERGDRRECTADGALENRNS